MFLLHFVICVAAYVVGWIAAVGIGLLFQPGVSANLLLIPGLPIAITNAIAASIACRRISSDGARWVWVPWALLIAPFFKQNEFFSTLNNIFGPNCGPSECLNVIFLGIPFVGSVVYAITSIVVRQDANEAADLQNRK